MRTVWDKRNREWVNIPEKWVEAPDFGDLFALTKPVDRPATMSAKKKKEPVKAIKEGLKDA